MRIYIKKDSPKTKAYFNYLISEIVKHSPLRSGELIEIEVSEKSTPFPAFTEFLEEPYFVSDTGVQLTDEKNVDWSKLTLYPIIPMMNFLTFAKYWTIRVLKMAQ